MTKAQLQQIMVRAHRIARQCEGAYKARIVIGLQQAWAEARQPQARTIRLMSNDRMSNTQYHKAGRATWWARIGSGNTAQFLTIGRVRGDEYLNVSVEIPAGVIEVTIGAGPNNKHGVREVLEVA